MKTYGWISAGCLLLTSCFARSAMMTHETFASIQTGTPIERIVSANGEPYSIETKNGVEEYRYVERVTNGNYLLYENRYTLYVKGGVVVGKDVKQEKVPGYDLIYQDDPNHNQYP